MKKLFTRRLLNISYSKKEFNYNSKTINNAFTNASKKYFSQINYAMKTLNIPTVTIVRDKNHAHEVLNLLKKNKNRFHAWDTETIDIDIKEQSPVLYGKIICMSCFIGPDVDFGNGPSKIYFLVNLIIKLLHIK